MLGITFGSSHTLCAMRNRRTFGFVVDIQDGKCDNTDSPFNFTVVVRLLFTSDKDGHEGFMWARIQAFSSNILTTSGEPIMEGTILEGILVATFGEKLTATFGTFTKSSVQEWRQEGAGPPYVAEDRDLDPWTWSPIPVLGNTIISNLRPPFFFFSKPLFNRLECSHPWKWFCHEKGQHSDHGCSVQTSVYKRP